MALGDRVFLLSDGVLEMAAAGALDPDHIATTTVLVGSDAFYRDVQSYDRLQLRGVEEFVLARRTPHFLGQCQRGAAIAVAHAGECAGSLLPVGKLFTFFGIPRGFEAFDLVVRGIVEGEQGIFCRQNDARNDFAHDVFPRRVEPEDRSVMVHGSEV